MLFLSRLFFNSIFVGAACGVFFAGLVGIWLSLPLAFGLAPTEELDVYKQLPMHLVMSGMGGLVIGLLGGAAAQFTSRRVSYTVSCLIVTACAIATIGLTHPNLNIQSDSTWIDYLESYRLTTLAGLGGALLVLVIGVALKPLSKSNSKSNSGAS